MELSIVTCLFVLDNKKNENKKKNDIKSLKIVLNKEDNDLIRMKFDEKTSIKEQMRKKINNVIGNEKFHLEQVYTFGEKKYFEDKRIDVIYMALTNIDNIKKLDDEYELVDFNVINNNEILLGDSIYNYKTERKMVGDSYEYYHKIKVDNIELEKKLNEMITAFKHLRTRVDNTDVCFMLLPDVFTLEDVRIVYELIMDIEVDKSNFRKKIVKFCEKVDMVVDDKGYRPSQMYKFNPDSIDIWL